MPRTEIKLKRNARAADPKPTGKQAALAQSDFSQGSRPLSNVRREKFVQNCVVMRMTAKLAYTMAGYTAANDGVAEASARALLCLPEVAARGAFLREVLADAAIVKTGLKVERVLQELATIALANQVDYWDVDKKGRPVAVNLSKVTRQQAAAIQEISVDAKGRVKLKLYDKRQTLVDVGKYLGMFREDPPTPAQLDPALAKRRDLMVAVMMEMMEDRVRAGLPPLLQKEEFAPRLIQATATTQAVASGPVTVTLPPGADASASAMPTSPPSRPSRREAP